MDVQYPYIRMYVCMYVCTIMYAFMLHCTHDPLYIHTHIYVHMYRMLCTLCTLHTGFGHVLMYVCTWIKSWGRVECFQDLSDFLYLSIMLSSECGEGDGHVLQ